MRRSIGPMFTLLTALSTPLAGQAWLFGFAGTLGGDWVIEAGEFGYVAPIGFGPVRNASVSVRAGWFGDNQRSIISHQRGFVGAVAFGLRSGTLQVFEVGSEGQTPTRIGIDLTVETAGYIAARSPLDEGKRWASAAVLPAIRVGQDDHTQFAILLGPAWFAGDVRKVHPFLGVRIEVPLARGRGGP